MELPIPYGVTGAALMFAVSALIIFLVGVKLARTADRISKQSGIGQAFVGGVFLGAVTSLAGSVTSVTAAIGGHPELAISNAIGGITAQTFFLAIADLAHRRVNLEHAAASSANMTQGALLVALLSLPLFAVATPDLSVAHIHPVSLLLPAAYIGGLRLISKAEQSPMWSPQETAETSHDDSAEPEPDDVGASHSGLARTWMVFGILALFTAAAGYTLTQSAIVLAEGTGLSGSAVGALLTATITSLPELVTAVAAVRQGALTLAVGDILGGNCFDILMLSMVDIATLDGSAFMNWTGQHTLIIASTLLMTSVLVLGFLRREPHGIANIGFESALVSLVYVATAGALLVT